MVTARRAEPDDVAELVRLRGIMLNDMSGGAPVLDDWQDTLVEDLRFRLADPARTAVAYVVDRPVPEPDTGRPEFHLGVAPAPGVPGCRLAACAVGLVEPRLGGPGNPTGDTGYILNVCTEPALRRRGYARACLVALLDWYRAHGTTMVDLQATGDGEALYLDLGFRPAPGQTMRLSLPD